ncbi:flavin-containing monooxygenase [Pseudonocardia bannensis]|uniref:NAD(P)/FAD-dependent oxidoreductase n=1 Tax=Pseudonocardia bannensis TaxID=630973 RepID=A0A848DBZ6_9PSEU|nr:NAD(P)/FAD-dependent oxidoreductase [Pseudonocardia bannensis]NMH90071.1 NAD(P)/FAD-dependent oxidoreductase [Pseudonocardia bannensis]
MSGAEQPGTPRRVRIAIIGAGFSGLGMAIRLQQAGIGDFEILERADDIGGTWRDNSYPGCAVDVQSHLYSFSFAPNPEWSHVYSPQAEIWDYIKRVANQHDVLSRVRFRHEVTGGEWDETTQRWLLHTTAGDVEAQFVISAMGPLSNPIPPDIPGLESFAGHSFHSARWDHDHDLTGKRVAVIGTGSSAAQFVPEIQPKVGRLLVFQRTPGWTFPRNNRRITAVERALYRRFPLLQRLVRARQYAYREALAFLLQSPNRVGVMEAISKRRMRRQVPDPELRAKLTPDYAMGCKRIIVADDFHPALARPNVEVVTESIREIRPNAVVTADGSEHEVDTLVLGTGFQVMPVADPLRGRDGVPLAERWATRREAYLGTTVAGYPNYFMLVGPNTATGHTSVLLYLESQIEYVVQALRHVGRHGAASLDVRPDVQDAFNRDLRERLAGTVWTAGGCRSWYLDSDGGTSALWPGYTWQFQKALRRFEPADYRLGAAPAPPAPSAPHDTRDLDLDLVKG